MNFGAQTKEALKKSSAFKSFHPDKKTLVWKNRKLNQNESPK